MKAGLGLGQGQGAGNQTAVATRRRGPNRREPGARASWGQRAERARQCSRAPAVTSGCGSALTTSPSTQGPAGTPDLCSGREAAWRPCTAGGPAGHALAPRPCFCHELGPGKASGRKTPGRISGRRNAPRERIKSQSLHIGTRNSEVPGHTENMRPVRAGIQGQRGRNLAYTGLEVGDTRNEGSTRPLARARGPPRRPAFRLRPSCLTPRCSSCVCGSPKQLF